MEIPPPTEEHITALAGKSPPQQPLKIIQDSLPKISQERLDLSLNDQAFDLVDLKEELNRKALKTSTVLYLGYGSNLSAATFKGVRGIKPISQINVVAPSLRLTFDLRGLPYVEPCFANTNFRRPELEHAKEKLPKYHKDQWSKGLVGVVYEVTNTDFAHIIETEGAGVGYQDILVSCYPLDDSDQTVPSNPTTKPFKAHTLFAPKDWFQNEFKQYSIMDDFNSKPARRDNGYAQPSARYLNLITSGAAEHNLPKDYQDYLQQIRPYTITSKRQQIGQSVVVRLWRPILMCVTGLQKKLADDKGRAPAWMRAITIKIFQLLWLSYFFFLGPIFGDGLRTQA